jgi:translation initiation factor 5B
VTGLRQPILSLLGHVDHGKTSLLDRIAGSVRVEHEPGGITQHIGAIEVPKSTILELCEGVIPTGQFNVPGLLFVDTPGHRSFATLRRRGGALADLAILVIDSREGIMPQTRESIQILRHEKTPFAVALTKIDLLSGWRKASGRISLKDQIARSSDDFGRLLDQRLYSVAQELNEVGFSAERYDRVSDFTRNVGIVPVSSKTGVGVPELLALMVGLAQRFLPEELALIPGGGEATILERSDQKGVGPVSSIILYRGRMRAGDELVVNGRSEPFRTRVRGIYRPAPTVKGHAGKGRRLASVEEIEAAAGVYVSAPGIEDALPGGLVRVVASEAEAEEAIRTLAQASRPVVDLAESGIILCADTLGGLEALAFECNEAKLSIHSVEVGPVNRAAVVKAATMRDPTHRAVLAFNVNVLPEAQPEGDSSDVHIFRAEVMYRLLDDYRAWKTDREAQAEKQRRLDTVHPAKFQCLPGYVFRASKPAIIGIKVLGGTVRPGVRLMKSDGSELGVLRGLQEENRSVDHADEGTEVAAAIEGAIVGRNLLEGEILYVALPESAARALRGADLSDREKAVLEEILKIRRVDQPFWGA